MKVRHLADVLAPQPLDEFLSRTWGQSFQYIPGQKGKFASLLPWKDLNRILQQHRLEPPRLRLAKDGVSLPPAAFLDHDPLRRGGGVPRLRAAELNNLLRDGATLVLDAVDEMQEPIAELARSFEWELHENIQVNAYAGWRTSRGFDLHWDDHDVLILQVAGRKSWSVYEQTRPYPLFRDIEPNLDPPEKPLWEGILNDGDVLYIPRGWWHVAVPMDEPSLHLTFGVTKRTGLDLLAWVQDQLRAREVFRKDLPRFQDAAERERHVADLRSEVQALFESGDLLERYFSHQDSMAQPRGQFSLPLSAVPQVLSGTERTIVRLTGRRPPLLREASGQVELSLNGKKWRFASGAMPVLRVLVSGQPVSIGEVYALTRADLDSKTVHAFLAELLLQGVIAAEEPVDGS